MCQVWRFYCQPFLFYRADRITDDRYTHATTVGVSNYAFCGILSQAQFPFNQTQSLSLRKRKPQETQAIAFEWKPCFSLFSADKSEDDRVDCSTCLCLCVCRLPVFVVRTTTRAALPCSTGRVDSTAACQLYHKRRTLPVATQSAGTQVRHIP